MPRPRKIDAQRRAERFQELYRVGKARTGLKEPLIAAALGIGETTLCRHKKNPGDRFSFNQVVLLGELLGWTDEDYLSIIHAKK